MASLAHLVSLGPNGAGIARRTAEPMGTVMKSPDEINPGITFIQARSGGPDDYHPALLVTDNTFGEVSSSAALGINALPCLLVTRIGNSSGRLAPVVTGALGLLLRMCGYAMLIGKTSRLHCHPIH